MRYIKTFGLASVAWGVGMFGYMTGEMVNFLEIDYGDLEDILLILIPGSVLFGILTTGLLYGFDRRRKAGGIDIEKDELRPSDSLVLNLSIADARSALYRALENLNKPTITTVSEFELRATTGVTWRSFGEVVAIRLEPLGPDQTLAKLSSKPRLPVTIIDYGTNSDNLMSIRQMMNQYSLAKEST